MPTLWWAIIRSTNRKAEALGHKLGYFQNSGWKIGFGCVSKEAVCEHCGGVCRIDFTGDGFEIGGESILELDCATNKARLERIHAEYLRSLGKSM
jgi:hypothetical protein